MYSCIDMEEICVQVPFMRAIFKRFGTVSMAPPAGPSAYCRKFTWY